MAETIEKIKNDERIDAKDLYGEVEDEEDEAGWTTREKRKSHGLTPSMTEPFIPTHTPSLKKQPAQPTSTPSAAPADNIIVLRPRADSVDEVLLPRVSGTKKRRNRNAACMPSSVNARAGLAEMDSDGNMRQTLDFEGKDDKDVASPEARAGLSSTYQAGPCGGYGLHLRAPRQSNRYSQAPVGSFEPYARHLQTPLQRYGNSQAQGGQSGSCESHLENQSQVQIDGSSQAEAYPTGTYGTLLPSPRQAIARKPVGSGQDQAAPSGTYQAASSGNYGMHLRAPRQSNGYSQAPADQLGAYGLRRENLSPSQTYGDDNVDDSYGTMNDAFIEDDTDLDLPSSPPTAIRREASEHSSPQLPRLPRPLTTADYRSSASFSAAAVQSPTRSRGHGENDLDTRVDEAYHSARGDDAN